jgi:hypothetical protein
MIWRGLSRTIDHLPRASAGVLNASVTKMTASVLFMICSFHRVHFPNERKAHSYRSMKRPFDFKAAFEVSIIAETSFKAKQAVIGKRRTPGVKIAKMR